MALETLKRVDLINYKGILSTPDMAHALRDLEIRASPHKWGLALGPKPGSKTSPLAKAGREVHLVLRRSNATNQEALNAAWSFLVPLGFTPWDRFPIVPQEQEKDTSFLYYFLGPWQTVVDRLLAEGRGHLAWPSFTSAALVDVGQKADRFIEKFVQAQLHRIDKNPGPVDGIIGDRTKQVIDSLALGRVSLAQLASHLKSAITPTKKSRTKLTGHISLPGCNFVVNSAGGVTAQKNDSGAILDITSTGRVILDIEPK